MNILALETSCDDTAVAIVRDGHQVLSNVRLSQSEHDKWGGVVPELAARLHSDAWPIVLKKAMQQAKITKKQIDLLAVTQGPGLQTSLLVGTVAGSHLSLLWQKPLLGIHHIQGHMDSVWLERDLGGIVFPALTLTISGGHTELHLRHNPHKAKLLGTTLDDAAGEAFDKTAKMLGLGYPGGPAISRWGKTGDRRAIKLPLTYVNNSSLDFSFSGLKAAIRRIIEQREANYLKDPSTISKKDTQWLSDLCASFEYTIGEILVAKLNKAHASNPLIKQLHFVGGVSANDYLREQLSSWASKKNLELLTPAKLEYCTDNAAMIASTAWWLHQVRPKYAKIQHLEAQARMKLRR